MDKRLEEIAGMIDHSLLHPTLTDTQIKAGCEMAQKYRIASVCVKPYTVPDVKNFLKESSVKVGTVVGFPHGNSSIAVKVDEANRACLEGALEVDYVVNVGKVLSQDWDYVSEEIRNMNGVVTRNGAILKVIFENDYYNDHSPIRKLCEICNRHRVAFIKTSTGYGFVKQENGYYAYQGATDQHVKLMCTCSDENVQVKAAGGIRTLDDLLRMKAMGVARIGTSATENILEQAKVRGYES